MITTGLIELLISVVENDKIVYFTNLSYIYTFYI